MKTIDEMIKLGSCDDVANCLECPFGSKGQSPCIADEWVNKHSVNNTTFDRVYIKHLKKIKLLERLSK